MYIKIELIDMMNEAIEEDQNDAPTVAQEYNWMKENTPLLKKIDHSMIMTQQPRHIKVSSLNIGKDDVFFVMDQDNRIDLEHADILEINSLYRVRVSLIQKANRRDSDNEQKLFTQNKHQFGNQFNTILEDSKNVYSSNHSVDMKKIMRIKTQSMHDLVPSKSSFSPPNYAPKDNEKLKEYKKVIPNGQSATTNRSDDQTFFVNECPMDTLYKNYKQTDRRFMGQTHNQEQNPTEKIVTRIKKLFKKGEFV